MSSVRRIILGLLATVGMLAAALPAAHAEETAYTTIVAHLSAGNEVSPPGCPAGVQ